MPLVFAQNESTESGITYDDRTGSSYQFPKMYRRRVKTGERFVYYKGRKTMDGPRSPQVYFGVGVVGEIREDDTHDNRFVCEILDYRPFRKPISFKGPNGNYYETGASRKGYFQQGVRTIAEADFDQILLAAEANFSDGTQHTSPTLVVGEQVATYASASTIREVDDMAMDIAREQLCSAYPSAEILRQPRNNPGFDYLVKFNEADILFVEVKGTTRTEPTFFITEGELQFSRLHAKRYRLLVIYGLNLKLRTYQYILREGEIVSPDFSLKPIQWMARVLPK